MSAENLAVLFHDLFGPVTNALSFQFEVNEAVKEINQILADSDSELEPQAKKELNRILEQDLVPCLKFVSEALEQLETRLSDHKELSG